MVLLRKNRVFYRFALFSSLLICIISSPLYSQSEELVERTVCIFDPANFSDNPGEVEWVGPLVADTLEVMLREEGYTVIEAAKRRKAAEEAGHTPEDFLDKETALEFAAALGADVAANGMFRVEGQEIIIGVKAYDIFTRRIAVAITKIGEAGIGIYDTVDEAAVLIAGRVRENLKPLPADFITVQREKIKVEKKVVEEIVSVGKDVTVTFYSDDEGAELYLGGEKRIGTIEDGKLVYTGKADTTVDVVIKKEHYHDHRQDFALGEEEAEFTLEPLYWKTKWDIGTQVMINQPIGLNGVFRYHFIPDWLTLHTRISTYYIPVTYLPGQNIVPEGFTVNPNVTVGVGWYPFIVPRSIFRFYIYAGGRVGFHFLPKTDVTGILTLVAPYGGGHFTLNFPRFNVYVGIEGGPLLTTVPGKSALLFSGGEGFLTLGGTWKH